MAGKNIDGVEYELRDSGYTLRQYFSHSTPEKGPGPGWDNRWSILEAHNVAEPKDLPDTPYLIWMPIAH